MNRLLNRALCVAGLILATHGAGLAHERESNNGYPAGDVRGYGAACDGTTDDHAALEAALASGEKVLRLPAGATCVTSAPLALVDGVRLQGGPGSTIEAKTGGTWTLGVLSSASANAVELADFEVDLNGEDAVGIYTATGAGDGRLVIDGIRVFGGATTTKDLITVHCGSITGEWCVRATNLTLECAASSGNGIDVTTGSKQSIVANSTVDGCDLVGIQTGWYSTVSNNLVTANGASAHGIEISAYSTAIGNNVTLTGTTLSEGITITGTQSTIEGNFVDCGVANAQCYRSEGTYGNMAGNNHNSDGDEAVGYYVSALYNNISGALGFGGTGGTNGLAHVVWGNQQLRVSGSTFVGAQWCARYPIDTPTINFRMSSTNCLFTTAGYLIGATGVHATGNTFNWTSATEGVWLGNDGTLSTGDTTANCTVHSSYIGNNVQGTSLDSCFAAPPLSSLTCSGILISANLCMNGSMLYDAAGSCIASCPTVGSHMISGNHMMPAAEVVNFGLATNVTDVTIKANGNGDVDVIQVENWAPAYGVWDELKYMCGMWEPGGSDHVDASYDLNPLVMGGTGYGLKPMYGLCQCKRGAGDCATPPQIQLVKMECTGGGDGTDGESCFDAGDCTGSCGINVGTAFSCLDVDQETTDWSDLGDIWLDSEERLGWSVSNTPGGTDAVGVWLCIYSL